MHKRSDFDTSVPVVQLRSDRHGGLGVTRSLGRFGVAVHVVHPDRHTPAFSSKYCRGSYVFDIERAPAKISVEYLLAIARRVGCRPVLIPTSDSAALFISANASALKQSFVFPILPHSIVESLYSKQAMNALAKRLGVPVPNDFIPQSKQQAIEFADTTAYPVMLKAVEQRRGKTPISRSKLIARNRGDLLSYYDAMADPEIPNVLLQEFIGEDETANWMFNGYFDERSECIYGSSGRKLRQHPPHAGVTTLGTCVPNADVIDTSIRFMKAVNYRGIVDIEYRFDSRDGSYRVVDVNPRVGWAFRSFVSNSGMDVVRAYYLDMTGQTVPVSSPVPGRKWLVEDLDAISTLRYAIAGELNVSEWRRSVLGVRETAFWAFDDIRPWFAMCRKNLAASVRHFMPASANSVSSKPSSSIQARRRRSEHDDTRVASC